MSGPIQTPDEPVFFWTGGARPLRFVKDRAGETWLCDQNVDVEGDLGKQGCWRCRDLAFTASD